MISWADFLQMGTSRVKRFSNLIDEYNDFQEAHIKKTIG